MVLRSGGGRPIAAVAGLLVWLMVLVTPAAGAQESSPEQSPPDQVDPPAEGEGEPLDDPSDPPPSDYEASGYAAHPSPSVSLSGRSWPKPNINRVKAAQRFSGAVKTSKLGWKDSARAVVITSGGAPQAALAASSLAGAVNGPLLLTNRSRLRQGVADEIKRLNPTTIYLVGPLGNKVANRAADLAPKVEQINGRNRYWTSFRVAEAAVEHGAGGTVIVANGNNWRHGLGVAALAAGKQWPVLLTPPAGAADRLANWVERLDQNRVLVVGNRDVVARSVVADLDNVVRVAGPNIAATAVTVARRGQNAGLDGRAVVVDGRHWADAATAGVFAGRRRSGVVLTTRGRQLSQPAVGFFLDRTPDKITIVQGASNLAPVANCQLGQAHTRNWYCAEAELNRQGYHVPQVDGRTDRFSVFAIFAFEKVAGLGAYGSFGDTEWRKMLRNPRMKVRRPDLPAEHVEINIGKQLILLIEKGKVKHHLHTSTGKPSTPMVRGTFTVYEKRPYRQSNGMYMSIFFYGGYAIHGYPSVPTYPASAGCGRVYDGNAEFIYPKVFIGERVATY